MYIAIYHFENVLGIEKEVSVFNVLTNFRYYFSKYEASNNLIPYLLLEKLTFSKLVGKVNFSEWKFEEMH